MTTSAEPMKCLACGCPLDMDRKCPPCEELKASEKARASLEALSLGGWRAQQQFTFERFMEDFGNAEALEIVKSWDRKLQNLYIHGPTGTGKTHLACAAARLHIGKCTVVSAKMYDIAREVRSCRRADMEKDIINRYVEAGVVIMDDLGQEKGTEFNAGIIYEIIEGRYMNRPGGLIVTTNLAMPDLAKKLQDDRITSRLAHICRFVSLAGCKDWRVKP